MNPLKIIPIVTTLGILAVAGAKVLSDLIEEEFDNKETTKQKTVKPHNIKISNVSILLYTRTLKKIQNELARAYDIKMLNDRLENTGLIKKIEIQLNGQNIDLYISELTEKIDVYIDHLKRLRNA